MGRNLKYQFKTAIDRNFKEGMDKHSMKSSGIRNDGKIYSYSDRTNMIDFSSNFANFMKQNHSEIKLARDIQPHHIQSFFNEKAQSCSKATLEQYKSKMCKLEKVVNNTYNTNVNYSREYVIPVSHSQNTKIRDTQMTREHYNQIKEYYNGSRCAAATAIELSSRAGLRVCEVVKLRAENINLENNTIAIIDSKGGRDREVEIQEKDRQYFEELKEKYSADEQQRICAVKEDTINKELCEAMKELNIKDEYADTGIHCIRKMYAQELYDKIRAEQEAEGYHNINEALGEVSEALGHSDTRQALMESYVLNIH